MVLIQAMPTDLPEVIASESQLDEVQSIPYPALVELMKTLPGDLIILGIAGKMGLALGRTVRRAIAAAGVRKQVIGVSRFSEPAVKKQFAAAGIETIPCDLLDQEAVRRLPQMPNVVFMAGRKFGTTGSEELTWAMNTVVPTHMAEHFPTSRIVVYSTGCVYPLTPVAGGGCREDDPPAPVGEYAQSALGRERIFAYFSRACHTPVCLIRLNYAIDLRYGVLREIGEQVLAGRPVDLTMGCVNVIWQGDAVNQSLLALAHCASPAAILNVTGPETVALRRIAAEFGRHFNIAPVFSGTESATALLNNSAKATALFGPPTVTLDRMIRWVAEWLKLGGRSLNQPTHFQSRDGRF